MWWRRSGALTVSEIAAAGLPAIFVPFQHKDRQYWNALPLENAGAAKILRAAAVSSEVVADTSVSGREALLTMAERARAVSIPDTPPSASVVSRVART